MTSPLTEARTFIADVLEAAGFNVYPYPPDAPRLPAAWMLPDDPWAIPRTLTRSEVNLRVKMTNTTDTRTRDALLNLEERAWDVVTAIAGKGARVLDLRAPETLTLGSLTVSAVEVRCSVLVDDDDEGA